MSFLNTRSTQSSQQNKSCIVITGGESGIGLELTKGLLSQGHQVIIVGKRQDKLDEAKTELSQVVTILCDISSDVERVNLMQRLSAEYPQVNVLINNAAVNHFPPPLAECTDQEWTRFKEAIDVDLVAPMHLSTLFIPYLIQRENALIVNVTCETAFIPVSREPIYSAAKAGLHALTLILRHQLMGSNVSVVEMIPPLVDTEMLPEKWRARSIKADIFAKSALEQLMDGAIEIGYHNEKIYRSSEEQREKIFNEWNK
jgi:uncharacterized oxidoreductase